MAREPGPTICHNLYTVGFLIKRRSVDLYFNSSQKRGMCPASSSSCTALPSHQAGVQRVVQEAQHGAPLQVHKHFIWHAFYMIYTAGTHTSRGSSTPTRESSCHRLCTDDPVIYRGKNHKKSLLSLILSLFKLDIALCRTADCTFDINKNVETFLFPIV